MLRRSLTSALLVLSGTSLGLVGLGGASAFAASPSPSNAQCAAWAAGAAHVDHLVTYDLAADDFAHLVTDFSHLAKFGQRLGTCAATQTKAVANATRHYGHALVTVSAACGHWAATKGHQGFSSCYAALSSKDAAKAVFAKVTKYPVG